MLNISIEYYTPIGAKRIKDKYSSWYCKMPKWHLQSSSWFKCIPSGDFKCLSCTGQKLEEPKVLISMCSEPSELLKRVQAEDCVDSDFWQHLPTERLVQYEILPAIGEPSKEDIHEKEAIWDQQEDIQDEKDAKVDDQICDLGTLTTEQRNEVRDLISEFKRKNKLISGIVQKLEEKYGSSMKRDVLLDIVQTTIDAYLIKVDR